MILLQQIIKFLTQTFLINKDENTLFITYYKNTTDSFFIKEYFKTKENIIYIVLKENVCDFINDLRDSAQVLSKLKTFLNITLYKFTKDVECTVIFKFTYKKKLSDQNIIPNLFIEGSSQTIEGGNIIYENNFFYEVVIVDVETKLYQYSEPDEPDTYESVLNSLAGAIWVVSKRVKICNFLIIIKPGFEKEKFSFLKYFFRFIVKYKFEFINAFILIYLLTN